MPTKETGSIFVTACKICGDELVVGWLRKDSDIPALFDKDKTKPATADANDLASGPITCTCGNITFSFDVTTGRAKVEWKDGDQPPVGNVNLH